MALYRAGDQSGAQKAWQRSATEPLLRVRAHAAVAAGRPNEALGPFAILADLHPDEPRSWLDLGEASLNQQDWTAAAAAYQHALQLDPLNLDAHYMIGYTAYYGRGDASAARAALDIVLESSWATDGQISNATVLMARMAMAEGRADEALDWYRRALTLRGALHLFPLREMADVYRSQGHSEQAIAALQEALREVPADPGALIQLGQLLIETGQPDQAIPYLQRATNVAPGDLAAQSALAEAINRARRPAELNSDGTP
jgi:tetratricopeptide (TPR) repeat protein